MLLAKLFFKKQKKTKIISTPSKDIRPIFNLCKSNAKQIIVNHLSKEEKYSFALNELKKCLEYEKFIKN